MDALVRSGKGAAAGVVPAQTNPDELLKGPGKNSLRLLAAVGAHKEDWGGRF
jgi:hypothetical protein